MKEPKSRLEKNILILALILFVMAAVVIFVYAITYNTKDCKRDQDCFRQNELSCKRSKVYAVKQDNLFLYQINGKLQDSCVYTISVVEVSPQSGQDIKAAFESKSMKCTIPLSQIQKTSVVSNNDIFDFCTGPLKEATYELIIKKIYGVIAQNLGPILAKADEAINQTKQLR